MIQDYTQKVDVKANSKDAFRALTQEVDKWWGSVDTPVNAVGDTFTITFGNAYWTFKIMDFEPNSLLVWECIDGQPELNHEWIGHKLTWIIEEMEGSIYIGFDQEGLNAVLPCFDVCSAAWDRFILISLKKYLETGVGNPGS